MPARFLVRTALAQLSTRSRIAASSVVLSSFALIEFFFHEHGEGSRGYGWKSNKRVQTVTGPSLTSSNCSLELCAPADTRQSINSTLAASKLEQIEQQR